MSEVTELEALNEQKLRLSRYVIVTASIGFIALGFHTIYRAKFMSKTNRVFLTILAGLPIGYGVSQLVNNYYRSRNQDENKEKL